VQQVVLFGSGHEEIKFSYVLESGANAGRKTTKEHAFEGIIPNLTAATAKPTRSSVREELARYRQHPGLLRLPRHASCAVEARNVYVLGRPGVAGRTLHEVSAYRR
jgi:excinuclease ABC subunit A